MLRSIPSLFRVTLIFLSASLLIHIPASACAEDFVTSIEPFLEGHCYECHDDINNKGGLDLYSLSTDLSDPATLEKWIRIYDRVSSGEMPPDDEPVVLPKDNAQFQSHLSPYLTAAHEAVKETVLRRLNRREYENTLNDLFGIHLPLAESLPDDGRAHGFDTVGEALGISMIQMQQYLKSAEWAIDASIAKTPSPLEPTRIKASYADMRGADKFIGKDWLKAPDGAVVFFHAPGYPTGMLREANAKESGYYRIKITGYAFQSDRPVTFSVGATSFVRGLKKPTFGYFAVSPGEPETVELVAWMDERHMIEITPQGLYDPDRLIRNNGIDSYQGPGLAINHVEIEGPLIKEFPSKGHRLIFEGLNRQELEPANTADKQKDWYKPKFGIPDVSLNQKLIPVLIRFASTAYRRPVHEEDIAPYLLLFQSEKHQGNPPEEALKTALTAILCSTEFLYLLENPGILDDYSLASRLSYFLTRTYPDIALRSAAEQETLSSSNESLREQASRLIQSSHFDRFIEDFTDSWLDLRSIEFTSPDEKLFPEFDLFLQHSMVDETRSFFRELIEKNLGIENLVKSDFAMLNWRLAQHYEIEGVSAVKVEHVRLPQGSLRGGLLSQASILKVSANGTNTSPVLRGVWVNERILGNFPAPPPPGIPGVEPDIRGAKTLREILDQHRDSENCQTCHQMIDPPGFALESFNPVGGWRPYFRSIGEGEEPEQKRVNGKQIRYQIGQKVDSSGQLQDGRNFSGYLEYRDLIAEEKGQLTKALLINLLTFGTGRELGFSDRPEIDKMVRLSVGSDYGIREIILLAISSEIFRHK